MPGFVINDPVFVNREGGDKLEGVVAFLGKVAFAEGDDWVGVRLTGKSSGHGKNDGSVKSQTYFKCPPSCGIFVRNAAVEARKLTKLEELRLRRELASQGITASTAIAANTAGSASSGSTTAGRPGGTPTGRQSRLEELRQRRAAISTERDIIATSQEGNKLVEDFNDKLRVKEHELNAMKERLSHVEKELASTKGEMERVQNENKTLHGKLSTATVSRTTFVCDDFAPSADPKTTWTREKQILEDQLLQFEEKLQATTKQLEKRKSEHSTEVAQLRSESLAYKNELQALAEQAKQKGVSDTSHYKEKAVLQAQIAVVKRDVQNLKNEKIDIESSLEDLTLDKEQLQEENERLNEKLEEVKLDAETAQMEVEELRMELEETKAVAEQAGSSLEMSVAAAAAGGAEKTQLDDMTQALSIQNARLREALIRLREQSSIEKMELTRKLKASEKMAETVMAQVKHGTDLETAKSKLEEEMRDLKEMVDQGAAFESMVEDLSDRLMEIEEQNTSLATTVRELEEAAELTTEMEEVQAAEIKTMTRDLEDRDTVIRNLEEAIKMQRKREEDFSRTVGNYRSTVETLKKEKEALLELQQGGEGEKSNLLTTSQKALARAAQLVSDAADTRKREALDALDKVEGQSKKHLAERYEKLLPKGVASQELAAIKGELLVSRIAGLSAASLHGIVWAFHDAMRGVVFDEDTPGDTDESTVYLTEESKHDVGNIMHQIECGITLAGTGSDAIRLLAAGQWPDLLSEQASAELGSLLGMTMIELEVILCATLKSLKEEGVVDTQQSNLDALRQTAKSVKHELESELYKQKRLGENSVPRNWKPPGLELMEISTNVESYCLGAAAAVAVSCKSVPASSAVGAQLRFLLPKLDSLASESSQGCLRLAFLDVQRSSETATLTVGARSLHGACKDLLTTLRSALLGGGISMDDLKSCETLVAAAAKSMSQFSSALRAAKLNSQESNVFHPLSPAGRDAWCGVSRLAKSVRAINGDPEDCNFLMRARAIENRLSEAVASEPKLALANSKVASLEKSLTTRSKEIAMQNARLSEVEKLLAKSNPKPSPTTVKSSAVKSSEELDKVKEENRVLLEAMDVLQEQVAGYENEIRLLNSTKSPKRHASGKLEARRKSVETKSLGAVGKRQSVSNLGNDVSSMAAVGVLQAALFRPALLDALRDAAQWKNSALINTLQELAPLTIPSSESKIDVAESLAQVTSALASYRMNQASIAVVDLSQGKTRCQLRSLKKSMTLATTQLDIAGEAAQRCLTQRGTASATGEVATRLLGKLKLRGREPCQTVAYPVSRADLSRLNLHVLLKEL